MAQNDKKTEKSEYTQGKRLARAKVKTAQTDAERAKREKERKKNAMSLGAAIFAVVLAVAMVLPYLAYIAQGTRSSQSTTITSTQIDEMYSEQATEYETTLAEKPDDLETLKSLGDLYMNWGQMMGYASDENASARMSELLGKAQECYDKYLAQEASEDVSVNRALCMLYTGDYEGAQTALEAIVKESPNCASAWANLGYIYELTNPDKAIEAYQKALEVDPDDTYQVQSLAQSRLEALQDTGEEEDGSEAAATDGTSTDVEVVTDDAAATDASATDAATTDAANTSKESAAQ